MGLGMSAIKVYLAVEPCDMRKGVNGLAVAAVEHLAQPLACDSAGSTTTIAYYPNALEGVEIPAIKKIT